jgi:hypothetical protein
VVAAQPGAHEQHQDVQPHGAGDGLAELGRSEVARQQQQRAAQQAGGEEDPEGCAGHARAYDLAESFALVIERR